MPCGRKAESSLVKVGIDEGKKSHNKIILHDQFVVQSQVVIRNV